MSTTTTQELKAAKQHKCSWCGGVIEAGTKYNRYRAFVDKPATIRMHLECYVAMQEAANREGGFVEFDLHEQRRGCPTHPDDVEQEECGCDYCKARIRIATAANCAGEVFNRIDSRSPNLAEDS